MEQVVIEGQTEVVTPTPAETGTEVVGKTGEATAPAASDGGQPAAEPTGEAGEQDETKKPPRGVQKRLDELTREKYEWKREADYWRDLATQKKPDESQKAQELQGKPQGKPNPDAYENYSDYIEALTDWKVSEQIQKNQEEAEKKATETSRVSEQQRIAENFATNVEAAKTKYADYDEVIEGATDAPCTQDMLGAMMESPQGAEVMYYLARNPQEAARIAKFSPYGQIREIGRIEARLATPPKPPEPRRITNTGEPPKTVSGAGVVERDPNKMGMEEYAAWRMAQERS